MYCLISATSKHQFKCTVHPSTLCGCWMSQKTQSQVGLTWNKMYSVANQWADTMNYKYYILKKKSRRPLKLPSDHSVGLISQHWILNKCIHDSNFFVDRQVNGHCLHLLALNVLNHSITWMYEQSRAECPDSPSWRLCPPWVWHFTWESITQLGYRRYLDFSTNIAVDS